MDDARLKRLLADEYANALGVDHDEDLRAQRELALNYYKGEMPDVPSLDNRSKAVSTDVADAIETVLPDLMDIFVGEDVATFQPVGEEDTEAAQQETDYVRHVVFEQNDGFMVLYTMIKDALLTKTGIAKFWWDDYEAEPEAFEVSTPEEIMALVKEHGERAVPQVNEDGSLSVVVMPASDGKVCIQPVPPEDFAVSRDTVSLRQAPYVVHRSRPRAYELTAKGIPAAKVDRLPQYGTDDEEQDLARDTVGESDEPIGGDGEYRRVEVLEHYLKDDKGYWRVLSDATVSIILEKERVEALPFAAITPYPQPHRFFGLSVADKLLEIQRIKTALTRMLLDSGYFALNQRMEVASTLSNEWTLTDLLRNEPNMPVRVAQPGAIRPLTSGGLSFDAAGALEYFSTIAEGRTGIVRNAQGLNPDTLHDTASGAMALMANAQKRVRMIARVFAETGVKDLFLGVHRLIRENAKAAQKARLRGQWVAIDPTSWGNRSDMTIEIGVGSGGHEQELATMSQGLQVMQSLIQMQGGVQGPVVTADNAYQFLKKFFERGLKIKAVDLYLSDPAQAEPQEPQPDPKLLEAQAKMQLEGQKAQAQLQLEQQKGEAQLQFDAQKAEVEAQLRREQMMLDAQLKREQADAELALKREQLAAELDMKRELMVAEMELKRQSAMLNAQVSVATSDVSVGGEPG